MAMNGRGEEEATVERALKLLTIHCVPMAMQAALKLNVLDILASADQELSAGEIVARMKAEYKRSISNPTAHIALDRVLRVLASHEVLSSSLREEGDGQLQVRKYGITAVSRYFTSGPQSLGMGQVMSLQKAFMDAWQLLDQAVLEDSDAFTLAHGKSPFLFSQGHPEFAKLFNDTMASLANLFLPPFLHSYDGFLDVNTLVDVGGGTGACLHAIVSKYPHIKGINFDMPLVVKSAPSYSGVEHVGGDMLKSIPQADAILLKSVLHNWSDESCVEILKNCYKALPKNGKVIVVDIVLSLEAKTTAISCVHSNLDLVMLTLFKGARERTQQEFQDIANAAGFKRLHLIIQVHTNSVLELYKD